MITGLMKAAWRYRAFVRTSVTGEFRARLARSRLGTTWIIIQPIAQVVLVATVLSSVMSARVPGVASRFGYVIYLLSGMLCWNLFAEIVQRSLTVFVDQAHLLKKMQFPRITLPLVVVVSSLVSNLALTGITLIALPVLDIAPSLSWLWLPVLIAITVAFAAGLGLLLGTLNVFARDVAQVTTVLLQFWFWVTPVVYPPEIVPAALRASLWINPLAALVDAYHRVLMHGTSPAASLWLPALAACVLLGASWVVFRRAAPELVDAL
jgi:lipopolysaccharide transport system permease protein